MSENQRISGGLVYLKNNVMRQVISKKTIDADDQ